MDRLGTRTTGEQFAPDNLDHATNARELSAARTRYRMRDVVSLVAQKLDDEQLDALIAVGHDLPALITDVLAVLCIERGYRRTMDNPRRSPATLAAVKV